jgi:arsenite-transporting ATPase
LWGQEPEISQTLETYWSVVQEWISAVLAWQGMDDIIAEEMAIHPGMEEMATLLYIIDYHQSNDFDTIIVDCAPTGETLRLLSFPEALRWWMKRIFPVSRRAAIITRPMIRTMSSMPLPDDRVFKSAEGLFSQLDQIQDILSNHDETSIRLVVNPEKMVIKEARRTFTYLNLYGYSTDQVICNRVIPDKVDDRYFSLWKESQSKYYELIKESFFPLPTPIVPLLEQEVVGMSMLQLIADALYGQDDPTQLYYQGKIQDLQKEDGYHILSLSLPLIDKGDISLTQNGEELLLGVGNFKRNIFLPHILVNQVATEAKYEDNKLRIKFQHKEGGQ